MSLSFVTIKVLLRNVVFFLNNKICNYILEKLYTGKKNTNALIHIIISVHFSLCYPASSYVCNDCNGNLQCQRVCALLRTTITTTWKKYTDPTKPSWWSPLPCKLCFGWSRIQNATIRKHCQWGCGKPPKVHTTVIRETTHPLKTDFITTSESSTAMAASNTQTESTPWKPQKNEQRLAFGDDTNLHIRYIWLLIGVVGVCFITTSVVVISKFSSRKRRVGVVLQNYSDVVVRIGDPFVV